MGGTCITTTMKWENKLVCCATNVGISCRSDCCLINSNDGFFTLLILSGATLLSSYEIDSLSTLILNKFVCMFLSGVKKPCIDYKDCAPILVGYCSCMKVFD